MHSNFPSKGCSVFYMRMAGSMVRVNGVGKELYK